MFQFYRFSLFLLYVVFVGFLLPVNTFSQVTFQRTFGNSTCTNNASTSNGSHGQAIPTSDGGYAVFGSYGAASNDPDVMLVKMNSDATTYWVKTISTSGDDENGYSGIQTNDGGYIIAGHLNNGSNRLYLIKTDSNGGVSWTKKYAGSGSLGAWGYSVVQTTDNGYLIAGGARTGISANQDMYMIKTSSDGTHEWAKGYSGTNAGNDYGFLANQTTDGGYAMTGYLTTASAGNNVFFVKTTSDGTLSWANDMNIGGNDIGYSFVQTTDGGYVITGIAHGNADLLLMKLDNTGAALWTKTYAYADDSEGRSIKQTSDGGFIIAGSVQDSPGNNMILMKTASDGSFSWCKVFGGTSASTNEYGSSVAICPDGGYLLAGYRENPGTSDQVLYVVKTNSDGMVTTTTCAATLSATPTVTARTATVVNTATSTSTYSSITTGGSSATPSITAKNPCNNSTTLPIELLSFSGSYSSGGVDLVWSTSSEINNDYFIVERSSDGYFFEPIGKVNGAGNSSIAVVYEFSDREEVISGKRTLYYRLMQIDYNGAGEFYGPIAVRLAPPKEWQLILQNTPSSDRLMCNLFLTEEGGFEAEMYDLQGRLLMSESRFGKKGNNFFSFNLGDADKGIYFIKIKSDGKELTEKFLKFN